MYQKYFGRIWEGIVRENYGVFYFRFQHINDATEAKKNHLIIAFLSFECVNPPFLSPDLHCTFIGRLIYLFMDYNRTEETALTCGFINNSCRKKESEADLSIIFFKRSVEATNTIRSQQIFINCSIIKHHVSA